MCTNQCYLKLRIQNLAIRWTFKTQNKLQFVIYRKQDIYIIQIINIYTINLESIFNAIPSSRDVYGIYILLRFTHKNMPSSFGFQTDIHYILAVAGMNLFRVYSLLFISVARIRIQARNFNPRCKQAHSYHVY